tara:strand:- start:3596 stop:5146 length:1551 start_codon:yes stop_codon:yes gene_type:complete
MPFGANDGQRLNIKMSDMIRTRTNQGGGGDDWIGTASAGSGGASSTISVPYSDATRTSTGFRLSMMSAVLPYTDSNFDGADTGIYSLYNNMDGVYGSNSQMYEEPVIFSYMNSRYRSSSTAAPSNINPPMSSSSMKMGDMVGVGNSCITTDNCGQTRGITNGITSTQIHEIHANHQIGIGNTSTGGSLGKGMSPGMSVNSAETQVQTNPGDHSSALNMGYSVYSTTHTNAWTHCKLNTKLCTGDRVLVIAHGGGGDMYTFSTTSPLYLRDESGGGSVSVGATVTTHMAPHKNQTGNDDNLAIYSAVATGDGATVVGVNPYHSSAQPYIFHIFCIKGPDTYIDAVLNATVKYTNTDAAMKESYNSSDSLYNIPVPVAMQRSARFYINISSSPFYVNSLGGGLTNAMYDQSTGKFKNMSGVVPNSAAGYNSYYHEGGVINLGYGNQPKATAGLNIGSFFTSICDYTGGTKGSTTAGKFGNNLNVLQGFYPPQYAYARPTGDCRVFMIIGRRGNPLWTG